MCDTIYPFLKAIPAFWDKTYLILCSLPYLTIPTYLRNICNHKHCSLFSETLEEVLFQVSTWVEPYTRKNILNADQCNVLDEFCIFLLNLNSGRRLWGEINAIMTRCDLPYSDLNAYGQVQSSRYMVWFDHQCDLVQVLAWLECIGDIWIKSVCNLDRVPVWLRVPFCHENKISSCEYVTIVWICMVVINY